MQPFQERVVIEKKELDDKLERLGEFLTGRIFQTLPEAEQKRLNRQYELMRDYSNVLGERIDNFSFVGGGVKP